MAEIIAEKVQRPEFIQGRHFVCQQSTLSDLEITDDNVHKTNKSLNLKKGAGADGIFKIFIKSCAIGLCVNNEHNINAVYTDFSTAFDRVNHCILLNKLNSNGIHGNALKWISSYLTSKQFQVKINGHLSASYDMKTEVTQGSHL